MSVCLSRSPGAAACGGFAAVGSAARGYRSIAARLASPQRMRAVPHFQLTQEAGERVVLACVVQVGGGSFQGSGDDAADPRTTEHAAETVRHAADW